MATDNVAWRKLIIPNSWGEKMVGILDDTGSHHVIVLCHGFRSSKEDAVLINLTSTFLKLGLSTFRFDFSGSGESEGEFQYGNYWKDAEDLRSVVTYLRGQKLGVEILVGHSKGGNAVLLYASKYKDVNTIVNISGRFHLERGIKKRLGENYLQVIEKQGSVEIKDRNGNFEYRVTKESLKERLSTDMKAALTSIPDCCRVLTVHGSKDETVSFDEAKEFERLIRNHRLRIVNDADHYFRQHQRVLASIVVDFVEDGLRKSKQDKTKVDFSSTNLYPLASHL